VNGRGCRATGASKHPTSSPPTSAPAVPDVLAAFGRGRDPGAGLTVATGRSWSMSTSMDGSRVHTWRFFSDNVRLSGLRGDLRLGALDSSGGESSVEPSDGTRTSCHVSNGAVSPSPPSSAPPPRGCAWNFSSENVLRALLPARDFGEPDGEPSSALGPPNRETRPPHPPGRARHRPHRALAQRRRPRARRAPDGDREPRPHPVSPSGRRSASTEGGCAARCSPTGSSQDAGRGAWRARGGRQVGATRDVTRAPTKKASTREQV
jgi:hypothetical protein